MIHAKAGTLRHKQYYIQRKESYGTQTDKNGGRSGT